MKLPITQIRFENAAEVLKLVTAAQKRGDFLLDFSEVKRVDSSAISLVLEAVRRAGAGAGRVSICNVPASFDKLESLYGLGDLFSGLKKKDS
jgi:ABC-type transporter Mla MlaB component